FEREDAGGEARELGGRGAVIGFGHGASVRCRAAECKRANRSLTGAGPRGASPRDPLYARQSVLAATLAPRDPSPAGPAPLRSPGRTALRNFAVTPRRLGQQCQRRGPRVSLYLRGNRKDSQVF